MNRTSKYQRLYGFKLKDLAVRLRKTVSEIVFMHKNGLLEKIEGHLPEKLDIKIVEQFNRAKNRCEIPSPRNTKYYIQKGVKFKLSYQDVFELWVRDKAHKMETPSLDRIDGKKGYTKQNCQFIEWKINRIKRNGKNIPFKTQKKYLESLETRKEGSSCRDCKSKDIRKNMDGTRRCQVCGGKWKVKEEK